jgi:Cu(I)/Ag(I) efflux system membrane protein CusA/SilA
MRRIAAPMIGGMISSTALTLLVIPAIYALWKEREITGVSDEATQRSVPRLSTIPT